MPPFLSSVLILSFGAGTHQQVVLVSLRSHYARLYRVFRN